GFLLPEGLGIHESGSTPITVRDYDREERGRDIMKPYGIREEHGKRYLIWQIWDFEEEQYDLTMYCIEDDKASATATTHVFRHRYYAIGTSRLMALMQHAGFRSVERLDNVFFHPVLVGTRT
ncbi:MAG: class I SAM-dependent methyltransferase, partial [Candidatus Tectomicrobia bacterium]|nr:class I SAM-dependent methyltransferase [Candidatus Tectomicrobia bacterium]